MSLVRPYARLFIQHKKQRGDRLQKKHRELITIDTELKELITEKADN